MTPKTLTILMVLISVVLYYGFITPLRDGTPGMIWTPEYSIPTLQSRSSSYAEAIAQISAIESGALKLNNDYLSVSSTTVEKSLIMLPDSIDKIKILDEVTAIANKAGISITNVVVTEESRFRSVNNVSSYTVAFSMRSRYSTFKRLMQEYEKNMRFFVIKQISIGRSESNAIGPDASNFDKEALSISVVFRIFYLKNK